MSRSRGSTESWFRKRLRLPRGIAARWMAVIVLTTLAIIVAADVIVMLAVRENYYDSARQVLSSKVNELIVRVSDKPSESRYQELTDIVQNFSETEHFEVMLIDRTGSVTTTSSGYSFNADEPLSDYVMAGESSEMEGMFEGYSLRGEHIIACTKILTSDIGECHAIRFVSSIKKVDDAIQRLALIVILVSAVVLAFSLSIGIYFVRSIVVPLGKIGQTAAQIADGDFDVRLESDHDDEIGDLCSIINDMASGLGESERLKNDFISSVSHELRTPLTAIKGWGETLKSVGDTDASILHKGIDIIISETERLSLLVEDLLDFSRMQSGNVMKFMMDIVDVDEELRNFIGLFEQRAAGLGIELELKTPKRKILVMADKNRLRQVFSNLIDNAIKYSRHGGRITVEADEEDSFAVVRVRDNGIGIPKDDIPSVTKRFYKASNSLTGSGIGLAVVREIVSKFEGTLDIESTLGKGTLVTVRIPLLRANTTTASETITA